MFVKNIENNFVSLKKEITPQEVIGKKQLLGGNYI